jgi:hypothetical protein
VPLLREIVLWTAVFAFGLVQALLIFRTLIQSNRADLKLGQKQYPSLPELVWVTAPAVILVLLGLFAFQAVYEG